jgi:hypothetical protein
MAFGKIPKMASLALCHRPDNKSSEKPIKNGMHNQGDAGQMQPKGDIGLARDALQILGIFAMEFPATTNNRW